MAIYLLHFEGSYSHDIEVDASDREEALKIGIEMFDCADANEFDFDNDPAPGIALIERDEEF